MQNPQLGAGDWANIITALVTSFGILLAYVELRRNTRVQRGQFLMEATERYFAESEARRLFYDIDSHQFQINFIKGEPGCGPGRGARASGTGAGGTHRDSPARRGSEGACRSLH